MRRAIRIEDVLKVVVDNPAITAIDAARELIARGQCENKHAIGAVDGVRRVLDRLVRDGKLRVITHRGNRPGFNKQKVYGPAVDLNSIPIGGTS